MYCILYVDINEMKMKMICGDNLGEWIMFLYVSSVPTLNQSVNSWSNMIVDTQRALELGFAVTHEFILERERVIERGPEKERKTISINLSKRRGWVGPFQGHHQTISINYRNIWVGPFQGHHQTISINYRNVEYEWALFRATIRRWSMKLSKRRVWVGNFKGATIRR